MHIREEWEKVGVGHAPEGGGVRRVQVKYLLRKGPAGGPMIVRNDEMTAKDFHSQRGNT